MYGALQSRNRIFRFVGSTNGLWIQSSRVLLRFLQFKSSWSCRITCDGSRPLQWVDLLINLKWRVGILDSYCFQLLMIDMETECFILLQCEQHRACPLCCCWFKDMLFDILSISVAASCLEADLARFGAPCTGLLLFDISFGWCKAVKTRPRRPANISEDSASLLLIAFFCRLWISNFVSFLSQSCSLLATWTCSCIWRRMLVLELL